MMKPVWRSHRLPSILLAFVLLAPSIHAGSALASHPRGVTVSAGITELKTLPQNWTDGEASWFYNIPQGSQLIPYSWFLHLEQPQSSELFRDTDHIRSLGYLPREPNAADNPDGLPIGFVKDRDQLGLTCAACHTGQVNFMQKAWLIDGAPTQGDVETLLRKLSDSLDRTVQDSAKFDRFAQALLGSNASLSDKQALLMRLKAVGDLRRGYVSRNMPDEGNPAFGPGRVDAFGAIMNEVATVFAQVPSNSAPANAPVSYPFLWDTPQHDRVQGTARRRMRTSSWRPRSWALRTLEP
jgi:hypothetical protein